MKILVTGGCGYIGSNIIFQLPLKDTEVVVIDNLSNSKVDPLTRIQDYTKMPIEFNQVDLLDLDGLSQVFNRHQFDCVIHCAGLKSVSESVAHPLDYYRNNVVGTLNLLKVMQEFNPCKNLIFSSSATIYGNPQFLPITENHPKGICSNPYGETKSQIETILNHLYASDKDWNIVILRYFNPVGANPLCNLGEEPVGTPNNLMPYITQVSAGILPYLHIYGNDYNTTDGTGVRDYIHVVDLARGHLAALKDIEAKKGLQIYNLGTGHGYSVLEMVKMFEKVNKVKIPYQIEPRRPGDLDCVYADSTKAQKCLGWKVKFSLEDMCKDSWSFQKKIS